MAVNSPATPAPMMPTLKGSVRSSPSGGAGRLSTIGASSLLLCGVGCVGVSKVLRAGSSGGSLPTIGCPCGFPLTVRELRCWPFAHQGRFGQLEIQRSETWWRPVKRSLVLRQKILAIMAKDYLYNLAIKWVLGMLLIWRSCHARNRVRFAILFSDPTGAGGPCLFPAACSMPRRSLSPHSDTFVRPPRLRAVFCPILR